MTRQLLFAAFLTLVATEAAGTAVFLGIFLHRADWRANAVGRHLVAYSVALLALLTLTLVALVAPAPMLAWLILGGHIAFDAVVWQRVALVWRSTRK